jgi:hypothetical protein
MWPRQTGGKTVVWRCRNTIQVQLYTMNFYYTLSFRGKKKASSIFMRLCSFDFSFCFTAAFYRRQLSTIFMWLKDLECFFFMKRCTINWSFWTSETHVKVQSKLEIIENSFKFFKTGSTGEKKSFRNRNFLCFSLFTLRTFSY